MGFYPASAQDLGAVLGQPGCQVSWAAEIEQIICQGFQLLQRQRLDVGNVGGAQGAAAAVEQAERDCGFTEGTATSLALASPSCRPRSRRS